MRGWSRFTDIFRGRNMGKINELIEWDSCGASYSLYIKHVPDGQGGTGATIIFEDVTRQKVTEISIPARKFPSFLRAVNIGPQRYQNII